MIGVIGLLGGTRWGWVLTMLLVGLGLVFDLLQYLNGVPVPISLALHVLAAFYLNQRSVRSMAADVLHEPEAGRPMIDQADDIELLQRFEPVVRYTDGEHFFPDGRGSVCRGVRPAARSQVGAHRRSPSRPGS